MAENRAFESSLHDIVYSIDSGTGLRIIKIALYILMLLVIVMVYTATQFRGLKTEESMDYGQLGRNISMENGLVTKTVRPLTMWKVQQRNSEDNPKVRNHPDLYHPPAYPAVLSAGFQLFELVGLDPFSISEEARGMVMLPAEQWVILPLNHLFAILTGWLLYCLGKRLFSKEIAFFGMTVYYLSNIVWQDSISGLNLSMAIFFSVAAFHSMIIAMLNKRDGAKKVFWIGPYIISILCTVVAFYTRYITVAIIPGICLFAWLMSGRFRGGTRFVVIFMLLFSVLIAPWLIRNVKVSGNPMGMVGYTALAETRVFPGNSLQRDYQPEISASAVSTALKEKWVNNFSGKHHALLPAMGGGLIMSLFLTTFFYHFVRPQVNYLRWGIALSMLLMMLIAGFFSDSSMQMLHLFWPFAILYGLSFFYILVDRLDLGVRLYNTALKFFFGFLVALPLVLTLMPPQINHPYPPYHAPIISKVGGMMKDTEVMCTDMPWATAWYGDAVSILLPKELEQFYDINDYKQYISGLYFTALTSDRPFAKDLLSGSEKSWMQVFMGQVPADFPLKKRLNINQQRRDQLFYSDMDRWSGQSAASAER